MERGKMSSSGRGGKSKAPQHPQDIFALGTKSTVVVSRDAEKRNIHKPSTSGVERKRDSVSFGSAPPNKRARIGSPAEAVGGTSLEVDPVDLVPNVLQALDTHNSDKLLGLLTGSIRLLKSQRSKPDPILCMGLLYLCKIRPNMFAHDTVTNSLCTLLKREQGAAFKNKGNPLVFVLACNMLYAGHRDSNNWPDIFIKVYIEDALNERWWVECSWCKCLVANIVTAFGTKQPPAHLIPTDNTIGTMSPSGSGSPLMGSNEDDPENSELEYSVFPRYSTSYEAVEGLVLEAIKEQIQRRSAAPDAIGKGFLKLLAATCGFPEIRMISASRLEGWLNSGKLWRAAQELLAGVCCNCEATGASAARDHEVLAQLARMRLKTKPLQAAYQSCLREMVAESPALLRSVVTHTLYNELSNVRAPNNMGVLAALVTAQPSRVPQAMGEVYLELVARPEEYGRPLRLVTRELARALRGEAGAAALVPLARALAQPPPGEIGTEVRERAFAALAELFACMAVVCGAAAAHARPPDQRALLAHVAALQAAALGWLLDAAEPCYRPPRPDYLHALNKIMFVEGADAYAKIDNWPPESERQLVHRLCCEAPLPQNNLLRIIFIGLSKEIPVSAGEVFELIETLVRRACALPPEDNPLQVDKLEIAEYIFQLCQFNPPDNITLPQGYTPPPLAITSMYWRAWMILTMIAAHNPDTFAERAAQTYPTLRALIETCITNKPSVEWVGGGGESERSEAERAAILQLETHLAAASSGKVPVAEHASRLLPQLCALEPLGPPRRPPPAVLDAVLASAQQLRLGRLLCRQPALLLALVERHGTRRALPWLHRLLRAERLPLAVLPVQCLCELLAAGGGERAPELRKHLRAVLCECEPAARAVLHHYTQRLHHHHAHARHQAHRGLKLVLSESDDVTEMDYNADVSPEEWLDLLWSLRQWEGVREEVVSRLRAACLVECVPRHLAAYVNFLSQYVAAYPDRDNADIVLELSQVVMERTAVMSRVIGTGENAAPAQHRALHSLTQILYAQLQKVRTVSPIEEPPGAAGGEGGAWGERVWLTWDSGPRAHLPLVVAHAHLKLLCLGPSMYDTNQEMYRWLVSVWVGADSPSPLEPLLPDWLRLQLVRSGRPPLLAAGLRGLSAHKLALFIQTFGMPVQSMSALLSALDACPAGAVSRLGVERGYLAQLLRVQRQRGATGGAAFAAALALHPHTHPPDENLFAEEPLPLEMEEDWECGVEEKPLPPDAVGMLVGAVLGTGDFPGDVDSACTELVQLLTSEAAQLRTNPSLACTYTHRVTSSLMEVSRSSPSVRRPAHAAAIFRALIPHQNEHISKMASTLLKQCKLVSGGTLCALQTLAQGGARAAIGAPRPHVKLPPSPTKEELVRILESSTPSTLEEIGTNMIETQDSRLMVDVIIQILENNQNGQYDTKVKSEEDEELCHVFSSNGRGCGVLLDWLAELQRETIPERQMCLMFRGGGSLWRALVSSVLAHRASWRALHHALATLLKQDGEWSGSAVLEFAETLGGSPRVWQARDSRAHPADTLRLTYTQLEVLIRYIVSEGTSESTLQGMQRRFSARVPLVLRCCGTEAALLAAANTAARLHPALLLLLYMKVPKIRQLLSECDERPTSSLPALEAAGWAGGAAATSATDRVSHAILTALPQPYVNKDHSAKVSRLESALRAAWSRWPGAGARALPLAAALLRGAQPNHARLHHHLLAVLEALPDAQLFEPEEIHSIMECFLSLSRSDSRGDRSGSGGLSHRVSALVRRYVAARPARAQHLLNRLAGPGGAAEGGGGASATPPPAALRALQRRVESADKLTALVQEVEAWGARRGGGWGGAPAAQAVARATAPLAAHPHAPLRNAALGLLAKLLPAAPDPTPGVQAILECLDSNLPEVRQSAIEKLPDIIVGMQEHASRVLMRVFELGMKSRLPVDVCLAKCVATINMQRGC